MGKHGSKKGMGKSKRNRGGGGESEHGEEKPDDAFEHEESPQRIQGQRWVVTHSKRLRDSFRKRKAARDLEDGSDAQGK